MKRFLLSPPHTLQRDTCLYEASTTLKNISTFLSCPQHSFHACCHFPHPFFSNANILYLFSLGNTFLCLSIYLSACLPICVFLLSHSKTQCKNGNSALFHFQGPEPTKCYSKARQFGQKGTVFVAVSCRRDATWSILGAYGKENSQR